MICEDVRRKPAPGSRLYLYARCILTLAAPLMNRRACKCVGSAWQRSDCCLLQVKVHKVRSAPSLARTTNDSIKKCIVGMAVPTRAGHWPAASAPSSSTSPRRLRHAGMNASARLIRSATNGPRASGLYSRTMRSRAALPFAAASCGACVQFVGA